MGHSLESRLPFLDYRVMELGVALPDALKLRSGRGKWIVREAMDGRLPETIRNPRYKRGFDVQQDVWIDEGLGDHIRGLLKNSRDVAAEYLAPAATSTRRSQMIASTASLPRSRRRRRYSGWPELGKARPLSRVRTPARPRHGHGIVGGVTSVTFSNSGLSAGSPPLSTSPTYVPLRRLTPSGALTPTKLDPPEARKPSTLIGPPDISNTG